MFALPRLTDDAFSEIFANIRQELRRENVNFSEQVFRTRYAESVEHFSHSHQHISVDKLLNLRQSLMPLMSETIGIRTYNNQFIDVMWNFGANYRAELGDPRVWNFLTLILLPDIASSRLSGDSDLSNRFTGGNRRHVFQRLWLRRITLGDSYGSRSVLTEDSYGAIMERRFLAERPLLAQRIAQSIVENDKRQIAEREYARALTSRIMQLASFVAIMPDDVAQIDAVVTHVEESIKSEHTQLTPRRTLPHPNARGPRDKSRSPRT